MFWICSAELCCPSSPVQMCACVFVLPLHAHRSPCRACAACRWQADRGAAAEKVAERSQRQPQGRLQGLSPTNGANGVEKHQDHVIPSSFMFNIVVLNPKPKNTKTIDFVFLVARPRPTNTKTHVLDKRPPELCKELCKGAGTKP
jgi:hypothetical protein